MESLHDLLCRLAHREPETRSHIVPLLRKHAAHGATQEQIALLQMLFPPAKVEHEVPIEPLFQERLRDSSWVRLRGNRAKLTPFGKRNLWSKGD